MPIDPFEMVHNGPLIFIQLSNTGGQLYHIANHHYLNCVVQKIRKVNLRRHLLVENEN